jgi:hypothetical protein
MEIDWTDVGSGGYILLSCAHSNTSLSLHLLKKNFSNEIFCFAEELGHISIPCDSPEGHVPF